MDTTRQALENILRIAKQYADNPSRVQQEVDHALCVEVLDEAERALTSMDAAPQGAVDGKESLDWMLCEVARNYAKWIKSEGKPNTPKTFDAWSKMEGPADIFGPLFRIAATPPPSQVDQGVTMSREPIAWMRYDGDIITVKELDVLDAETRSYMLKRWVTPLYRDPAPSPREKELEEALRRCVKDCAKGHPKSIAAAAIEHAENLLNTPSDGQ